MKRSIDWGHVIALAFLYILLGGMCLMLYDTIVHDNDTSMIVTAYIITVILFIAVIYVTHFFIVDFTRKERRRKTQKELAKEMRLLNDDPHYKGDKRYVDPVYDERIRSESLYGDEHYTSGDRD